MKEKILSHHILGFLHYRSITFNLTSMHLFINGGISLTSQEGNFLFMYLLFCWIKGYLFLCNAARAQSFIDDPSIIVSNMVSKTESSISSYLVQRKILKVDIIHIL